ncbi:endoplasmic reticulum oxidoreductins 2 [Actinidia rufa]|uniref:Endoplasmic reticulum oxidoreductins 2 n=1 Tax=Actinidia rufa TaxID=165716 RepID=A0A7J0ERH9_9ERIC|nr:endoplasmic reticulum oxidoreductins 2 [Actinidia rufa]
MSALTVSCHVLPNLFRAQTTPEPGFFVPFRQASLTPLTSSNIDCSEQRWRKVRLTRRRNESTGLGLSVLSSPSSSPSGLLPEAPPLSLSSISEANPVSALKVGACLAKLMQDTPAQSGIVEDCCCDYGTVDHLNEEVLNPLLQKLVNTPFFRYFKVKLWCDCPFWPDDGMCHLRDCSVCECPEHEFPEPFKRPFSRGLPSDDFVCQEGKAEAAVDRTIDTKAFRGWIETDNPWTNDDETDNDPSGEFCQEEKILYKLISGLHSSISIHIAADYLLDEAKHLWGQNLTLMYDRVLRYPDRISNLYFTFLFVLRAVTKAADYLEQAEYDTGNPEEDLKTKSLMTWLLYNPKVQTACPLPFDEAKLWKCQRGPELKQQIQRQFKNISALMDCVGCEKCRLWGKLQVLGLGTALKILFSVNGQENLAQTLQRNEVNALMNLLHRLSESILFVHEMGPTYPRPLPRLLARVFGKR